MPPESRKLLEDMRDAATEIDMLTRGRTAHDYLGSRQLRWCVERGFEIVATAMMITDYRKIISFRNVLIHGYSTVNNQTTWDIVQQDLPVLLHQLQNMLK